MSLRPYKLNALSTARLGRKAFRIERTPSTQDDLKTLLDQGHGHGTLVWADYQTSGRGTHGRTWHSLTEPQLMVSFAIEASELPKPWPLVNLAVGIAVTGELRRLGVASCGIKWPNDVYIQGKKVAGILSEVFTTQGAQTFALVGFGLNHQGDPKEFPAAFRSSATVLNEHLALLPSVADLLVQCLAAIETTLATAKDHAASIQDDFERLWIYPNQRIQIDDGVHSYQGTATAIREDGALLLVREDGKTLPILSGTLRLLSQQQS